MVVEGLQRGKVRAKARCDNLENTFGSHQVLEAVRAQVAKPDIFREPIAEQLGRHKRHEDLGLRPRGEQPCGAVRGRPKVVPVPFLRRARCAVPFGP